MTEPSKFFTQHHAVEAPVIDDAEFRPYWRVRPRLDQLLADRAITIAEWRAAVMFRILMERVISHNLRVSSTERHEAGSDMARVNTISSYLDAAAQLGAVRKALGSWAFDLLDAHIVDDLPWRLLGARYGVHAKTVRSWTVVALRALASIIWTR